MATVTLDSVPHTYASAIVESQKLHARKPADFYPTPPDVTVALLQFLDLPKGQFVWEPACGDGAMAKVLQVEHEVLATDLRQDSGFGNGGVDFLETTPDEHLGAADWIITNPPFNVAEKFIYKALSITPNVAMLLKSQFWHAKRREPLFRQHPPAWVLPLTWRPAFLEKERGKSPLMDVIWVVWSSDAQETRYTPINRPSRDFIKERFNLDQQPKVDNVLSELLGEPTIQGENTEANLESLLG